MYEIRKLDESELELALLLTFDEMLENTSFRKFKVYGEKAKNTYINMAKKYHIYNSTKYYGLFLDEELIGVIELNGNYINQLAIKNSYQKRGFGSLLLNSSFKEHENVIVDAAVEAVEFYEKLGFVRCSQSVQFKPSVKMKRIGGIK